MEKVLFTLEEWAKFKNIPISKAKTYDYLYEMDLRIAETILRSGVGGVVDLLEKEVYPEIAGHLAYRICKVYRLLQNKGLI